MKDDGGGFGVEAEVARNLASFEGPLTHLDEPGMTGLAVKQASSFFTFFSSTLANPVCKSLKKECHQD